jgi:TfoX/Sxy family transcriptional regulator of competence genes
MPFNEHLAERIRRTLNEKKVGFDEKRMIGGLCFMVNDKMCVGVEKDKLMARIGPEVYEESLKKKGCRPMDFTGKVLKNFVFVEAEVIDKDKDLDYWIDLCLAYNPKAKSSKKRK